MNEAEVLAWVDAGCSVVPIATDGTKKPDGSWKAAQAVRATREVAARYLQSHDGIGVVCGAVSGNLEMFELEGRAIDESYGQHLREVCRDNGLEHVLDIILAGCVVRSPSGGIHAWYRISDGPTMSNTKLARRLATDAELAENPHDKIKVLIETRGEGGQAIVPPSGGRTHPNGGTWAFHTGSPAGIPTITTEERDGLYLAASLLDKLPVVEEPSGPRPVREPSDGKRPGDDFNVRATWDEILTPHGWLRLGRFGAGYVWRRPGKDDRSIAATTGTRGEGDNLFVFSTSTVFDDGKPISKFYAYAVLEHNGDLSAAAKALRKLGYGDQDKPRDQAADLRSLVANPSQTDGNLAVAAVHQERPAHDPDAIALDNRGNYRGLRLLPASAFKVKRVKWLWEGRMAMGELSLIAGREGIGKSTCAYWVAARVSRGELEGHYHGEPRGVLVCATEDSWEHTIVPRLIAAGADLDHVHCIDMEDIGGHSLGIELPLDLERVALAATTTNAALLLLDPLMSRLDGKLDTHKDGEVRRALEPLVAMCHSVDLSVVGLIHLNKSTTTDPLNAVMGSRAFAAVARSVSLVVRDPADEEERRRLFGTPKNNLGRDDLPLLPFTVTGHPIDVDGEDEPVWTSRIEWQDPEDGSIQALMEQAAEGRDARSATDEALDWLTDWLATQGGEAPSRDAKAAGGKEGHSQDSLKRALRKTQDIAVRSEGMPRRTVWYLAKRDNPQSGHARGGSHLTAPTAPTDSDLHKREGGVAPTAPTSGRSGSSGMSPRASCPNRAYGIHAPGCDHVTGSVDRLTGEIH